ncbi:hypothetical protein KR093_008496 [Drosophila rubida]|uniref:Uncharacterized protein n=1 Tax=Drosophila rubida TaxID=30044 RepID=A0AAD4PP08_9MUSC|nr:hypothetical protein KR093_008496 [Drosophila rubida]
MENKNQLDESELDLETDLDFIDDVLEQANINVSPSVRGYLLDQAFTMARDQLLQAQCFSRFAGKSSIDEEDLKMASMDNAEELKFASVPPQAKPLGQHLSAAPTPAMGLLLPPWRNCQVGVNAQLKQLAKEAEPTEAKDPPLPAGKVTRINSKLPKNL